MTEQNRDNDLVFRTNGEETFRLDGNQAWKNKVPSMTLEVTPAAEALATGDQVLACEPSVANSISFSTGAVKEIARFTEEGFYYKGEFVDDAGEVHRLLKDALNEMRDSGWRGYCQRLLQAVDAGNKEAEELVLCQMRSALD